MLSNIKDLTDFNKQILKNHKFKKTVIKKILLYSKYRQKISLKKVVFYSF